MKLNMLVGFWSIVGESLHVLSRNGKAMAFFSLLIPTIYSVLYLSNIFSVRPLVSDLIIIKPISFSLAAAASSPSPSYLTWIIIIPGAAATWFFLIATVLASAAVYSTGKALSLKEALLRAWESSWKRPYITVSYTILFLMFYIFLISFLFMIPLLLFMDNLKVLYASFTVLGLVAILTGTYLYVTLTMAIVVSILEETSGIKAMKRAREVVKGMELHGFALNLLLLVLSLVVYPGLGFIPNIENQSAFTRVMIGFIVMSSSRLVGLFGLVSYTVLYYRCKKSRGEEIEFSGIEYATLPYDGTA